MIRRLAILAFVVATTASCYHATVHTGAMPSNQRLEREWAHGFLWGLVPPSEMNTIERCPNGVAQVETELSFLNQLVTFLTSGIYTPMTIVATCASLRASDEEGGPQ